MTDNVIEKAGKKLAVDIHMRPVLDAGLMRVRLPIRDVPHLPPLVITLIRIAVIKLNGNADTKAKQFARVKTRCRRRIRFLYNRYCHGSAEFALSHGMSMTDKMIILGYKIILMVYKNKNGERYGVNFVALESVRIK